MKKIIIALVVLAAGFFGYRLSTKEECPGGKAFETVAECQASGLTAEICTTNFKTAGDTAASFKPIESMEQCQLRYPHCVEKGPAAFVPAIHKVCIVAGKPATPLYGTIGMNIAGGH
jgi:uncharacterized protein YgiB involved in biofilm formation